MPAQYAYSTDAEVYRIKSKVPYPSIPFSGAENRWQCGCLALNFNCNISILKIVSFTSEFQNLNTRRLD